MDIVSALRATLAGKVGAERFDLWFGTGTWFRWDQRTLTIGVPTRFFRDWISSNFRRAIELACLETLGQCPAIAFHVDSEAGQPGEGAASAEAMPQTPAPPTAATPPLTSSAAAGSPTAGPAAHANGTGAKPANGHALPMPTDAANGDSGYAEQAGQHRHAGKSGSRRKFATLSSFVMGQSNRLAFVSAEMVAREPGKITPLLIHGSTSVGKTHLLEGIWNAAQRNHRGHTAIYLSAEQFTTLFLEALRGSGLPNFRRKYRGVGLLILDDLQFLVGKRATQVELLHTIDTLMREGRQLVFSADRPPNWPSLARN